MALIRRDQDRLQDILDAITAIERHAHGGRERFDRDELIQVWCLRHLARLKVNVQEILSGQTS